MATPAPILVFDIETIPDVATGKRLYPELAGLSDNDAMTKLMALREQDVGHPFMPLPLHHGVSQELWVPMQAVMGIYARENSQGMFFDPTEYDNAPQSEINASQPAESTEAQRPKRENKAGLKILD